MVPHITNQHPWKNSSRVAADWWSTVYHHVPLITILSRNYGRRSNNMGCIWNTFQPLRHWRRRSIPCSKSWNRLKMKYWCSLVFISDVRHDLPTGWNLNRIIFLEDYSSDFTNFAFLLWFVDMLEPLPVFCQWMCSNRQSGEIRIKLP